MSIKLSNLQKKFSDSVVFEQLTPELESIIDPGGKLKDVETAFSVYQQGYPTRLTEALGETYDGVWSVLGDDEFFSLCKNFVAQQKSQSYNLSDYHHSFSQFLATQKKLVSEFPFLPELASFEWAFHELFHRQPDKSSIPSTEEMSRINDDSQFSLVESLRLFDFKYKTYSIWKQRETNQASPIDFRHPEHIAVFKINEQNIKTLSLQPWQLSVLNDLQKKMPLGEVFQKNMQHFPVSDVLNSKLINELFSLLVNHQLITDIF